jgi:nucleotidyltransferase/DNA polymerase involved in DNA repair
VNDVLSVDLDELGKMIGKDSANFLYDCARGIDREPVVPKGPPKQASCSMSLTPIECKHNNAIFKVIGYLAMDIGELSK